MEQVCIPRGTWTFWWWRGWWWWWGGGGGREGWKREFLNTLKKYLYNTAFPLSKIAKYAWPVWKCINYHCMHTALNLILCKLRSNIFKVSCPLVHKSTYSAKYFAYSIKQCVNYTEFDTNGTSDNTLALSIGMILSSFSTCSNWVNHVAMLLRIIRKLAEQ